jgi:signal transduction histidine kinase
MRADQLLRSRVFRLTLVSTLIFGAIAAGVVALLYRSSTEAVSRQIDATIEAEIAGLAEQYAQLGTTGLVNVIKRRASLAGRTGGIYLLANAERHPIAGNLNRWPDAEPDDKGWIRFAIRETSEDRAQVHHARGRVFRLQTGLWLLVGHDTAEQTRIANLVENRLLWAGVIAIGLAVAFGALLSWLILRRIDAITATSREIMAGDLSHRIPAKKGGDEFDRLAQSLNAMLDQNERLFLGLQEVAQNIAHDLRSPLGRLRARLERLLADSLTEPQKAALTEEAIAEADRLLRTFRAILSIAQAESGAPRRGFEPVDLTVLIDDLSDLYGPLAEDAGLSLAIEGDGAPLTVSGDRDLLFQACVNLVDNALKYAREGKRIDIRLRRDGDPDGRHAAIEIRDHGPGIPAELLGKAKDRFYRVEASRTTEGSGLGLSLADAVARLHEGELELADNGPGLAAILRLPRLPDSAAPRGEAKADPLDREAGNADKQGPSKTDTGGDA